MQYPNAVWPPPRPPDCNAALVLADGAVFWGRGIGAAGQAVGEVCFNTAITGYQEILTDPSYAGQIITFTFPHIGNVGANPEDIETTTPAARGLVVRCAPTEPSNYRAEQSLDAWLKSHGIVGICGVDTRRLTRRIRDHGAPNGVIAHAADGRLDVAAMREEATAWPGLEGMDLAKEVSCRQTYEWNQTTWRQDSGYGHQDRPRFHVVAVDYGAKRNILRMLAEHGCRVTVVPATATTDDILRHKPDGVFLSNGPGDPAATGEYAVPVLRELVASGKPVFGICLGHQMLALALGGRTYKLDKGHRGANHPVRDEETGKVEITSQNHGFAVDPDSLPDGIGATHTSLFDRTNEGLSLPDRPVFSVQHHPEASPGPQDSHYLFQRFIDAMADAVNKSLRTALDRAVEPEDVEGKEAVVASLERQISRIETFKIKYNHHIKIYRRWSEDLFEHNCFTFALDVMPDKIRRWSRNDVYLGSKFIKNIIENGTMDEKSLDDLINSDVVIYFDSAGWPKHAGRVLGGAIISKWGGKATNVWEHHLLEVPGEYGEVVRAFRPPPGDQMTNLYIEWAKSNWHEG